MDNIIIIIAVVAFFIFSTYSNYKKEQEKANTRNPSIPQKRPTSTTTSQEVPVPLEIPKWLEDFLPPQPETKPVPLPMPTPSEEPRGSIDYKPVKYQKVKYVSSELPADLLKEYRNLSEKKEMEELKRSAALHRSHLHQINHLKPVVLIEDVQQEDIEVPRFQLREAIIMNAILERPYS